MKYKFIIFDIDGTLIDTEFAVLNSLKDTILSVKGKDLSTDELRFALGIPSEEALMRLGVERSKLKMAYDLWNLKFEKYIPRIKLFPGIFELLQKLSNAKIPLGLLTSKDRIELDKDFIPLGIMEYFNYVITAESTDKHKPYPESMLKILAMACINPSEAIYIGDSMYDMDCASSAGVDSVLALWGRDGIDGIEATYYANNPSGVWDIIQK